MRKMRKGRSLSERGGGKKRRKDIYNEAKDGIVKISESGIEGWCLEI